LSVFAILAAYLLCSTTIQPEIRAAKHFCSCELPCRSVECVLLHCFNVQAYRKVGGCGRGGLGQPWILKFPKKVVFLVSRKKKQILPFWLS